MRLFAPEPPCLELRVPTAEDATEWYALFRDTRVMEYLGRPADSLAHYEDMVVRARAISKYMPLFTPTTGHQRQWPNV